MNTQRLSIYYDLSNGFARIRGVGISPAPNLI
jgi:hypothetical protein